MSQLTSADVNYLKTKTLEKQVLEERAKASQNFDDRLQILLIWSKHICYQLLMELMMC
jgi:hypothetical protein